MCFWGSIIGKRLLSLLFAYCVKSTMMTESADEALKRDEMIHMYEACKEALGIIGDISMSTVSTSLPPPVKNDWLVHGENSR